MTGLFNGPLVLAQAEGAPAPNPTAGCTQMALLMVVIIAIFYFMVIRPQRKQQVEHQRFLDRLKEGDRVITNGGILGRIVALDRDVVTLDVGDRTRIRFLRSQITRPLSDSEGNSSDSGSSSDADAPKVGARKRK